MNGWEGLYTIVDVTCRDQNARQDRGVEEHYIGRKVYSNNETAEMRCEELRGHNSFLLASTLIVMRGVEYEDSHFRFV